MKRHALFSTAGLSRRTIFGRSIAAAATLGLTTRLGSAAAQDARREMAKHP